MYNIIMAINIYQKLSLLLLLHPRSNARMLSATRDKLSRLSKKEDKKGLLI